MVRAYFPQSFPNSITTNTNYTPEGELPGSTPAFNDEAYVNSGDRGSSAYVSGGQRGKVDYEDII